MLRRLAWSSVPSPSFSEARLGDIVATSRARNARHHVSGMLLFTGAQFLGVLEGDEQDLANLWRRLETDSRHQDLVRIGEERCGGRWFPTWLMAYGSHADMGTQIEALRADAPRARQWSNMLRPIMMTADSI